MKLPFEENIENGFNIRTFSSDINENELKWHFDEEDRIVVCEHETDWQLQIDNELPTKIEKNKKYFIPEGEYHRIIKGNGDLIVKGKKIKNLQEQIDTKLPRVSKDATYVAKNDYSHYNLKEPNKKPSYKDISFDKIVTLTIDNIEGGYYNPNTHYDSGMGSSGETMFGMDRKHGSDFTKSSAGRLFWSLIDNDRKINPKKWKRYYKLDDNTQLKTKLIQIITNNWLIPKYETLTSRYLTKEAKNIVDKDGFLKYHFSYAIWNGEGWFKKFANVINKILNSGYNDLKPFTVMP
jgi:hypothetical protein